MDALIKWISERLAERSSRRGFFSRIEKALLGVAVIVTGQGCSAYSSNSASSNSAQKVQTLPCCDPTADICPSSGCPSGSSIQYAWLCHTLDGGQHYCNDCYDASRDYQCTYMSTPTSQS